LLTMVLHKRPCISWLGGIEGKLRCGEDAALQELFRFQHCIVGIKHINNSNNTCRYLGC